jgi:hypothetical protein
MAQRPIFPVRMNPAERAVLRRLAAKAKRPMAEFVRVLIVKAASVTK